MAINAIEEIVIDRKIENIIEEPGKYKVVFLNDDSTSMDFVIQILCTIFKHAEEAAHKLTIEIHETGSAVVGTYTYEIAEQKTTEATLQARKAGFPLSIIIEKL